MHQNYEDAKILMFINALKRHLAMYSGKIFTGSHIQVIVFFLVSKKVKRVLINII